MLFFKRQLTSVDVSFPHYFTQLIIGPLFLAWRTNIFIYFFMTCSPLMWGLNLLFFLFSFLPMNWKILLELSSLLQVPLTCLELHSLHSILTILLFYSLLPHVTCPLVQVNVPNLPKTRDISIKQSLFFHCEKVWPLRGIVHK